MPDLVTIESAPPAEPPISVSNRFVMTRNSLMASWLNLARARPSTGSVKSTPSTRIVDWLALPAPPMTGWFADEAVAAALALHAGREERQCWKSRLATGSDSICSGTMLVDESVL